ncbi:hypothetical protein ACQP3C_25135, partial [Escherichia coli]
NLFIAEGAVLQQGNQGKTSTVSHAYNLSTQEVDQFKESHKERTLAVVLKKMAPKGSGTVRRCGFVGVGVALLEEVCHCGDGL